VADGSEELVAGAGGKRGEITVVSADQTLDSGVSGCGRSFAVWFFTLRAFFRCFASWHQIKTMILKRNTADGRWNHVNLESAHTDLCIDVPHGK